jgi:hypothetical protein
MSNSFYNYTSGVPVAQSRGTSSGVRNEFFLVDAGFAKLPALTAKAGKVIVVNAGETALEAVSAVAGLALTGGSINNTPIGAATPSTAAVTSLSASVGITGNLTGNVGGDLAGNVTSAGTSSFNNVAISGTLDMNAATSATVTGLAAPVNSTDAATKLYVDTSVANLIDSAPGTLDTLNELAAALGDDPSFATSVAASIATKLPLAGGTLSGVLNMGSQKITALATPTVSSDAVNLSYVTAIYGSMESAAASAVSAGTSESASAASASASSTSAGTSSTQAGIATSAATAASASEASASTSATGASNSAAAASGSATAAGTSATAAGTSATTASTQAGIATTQAGTATSQATTATTQATAATTQASNASTSATAAAGSASAAASSAAGVQAYADAAAASYDAFDDRYLGSKSSLPTLDNDGNALLTGALYYDTTATEMRVYTGTLWKATGSAVNGTAARVVYTATAAQTTFNVVYDAGYVDAYLNGVKQVQGVDFTASSGVNIVFAAGLVSGDIVDIVAYGAFELADVYTKVASDARYLPLVGGTLAGDIVFSGTQTLAAAKVTGLAAVATSGAYADLSGTPSANSLLPSQTGNNGKYLTTDGANPSWAQVNGAPDFLLMSQGVI